MILLNEEIKEQERQAIKELYPYKGNIREIKSYLTTELIRLEATQSTTLTGIELMRFMKL